MKVGESGFLNLTAEWRDRARTNRAGLTGTRQYDWVDVDPGRPADHTLETENPDGTVTAKPVWFDAREYSFERQNFRIGDTDSSQKTGFYNFGLPLAEGLELYFLWRTLLTPKQQCRFLPQSQSSRPDCY